MVRRRERDRLFRPGASNDREADSARQTHNGRYGYSTESDDRPVSSPKPSVGTMLVEEKVGGSASMTDDAGRDRSHRGDTTDADTSYNSDARPL